MRKPDTVQRILDVSQQMLQVRGYNALNYGDVSEAIGVHLTCIQYHFPSKSDLAKRLRICNPKLIKTPISRSRS
jgi:TetR/AcrR family transcriptional regulator, transcriptional repressor for nem operon